MVERLLSVHDLAGLTGWSPLTIYKKAAAGIIPGRVIIGKRSLRFKQSDVLTWLLEGAAGHPSPNSITSGSEVLNKGDRQR